jgi:hypothetical protein
MLKRKISNKKSNKYKKLKVQILDKYDKNNDNFITIREYLAKEISRGSSARKGNVGYYYQNIINIYNFFTLLVLKKVKAFKIMCIPQFEITFGKHYIERTTALYDLGTKKYYFPKSMVKSIHDCFESDIRLIYFTFIITHTRKGISHANIVIIDLKEKTLERFEPYGCTAFYNQIQVNSFYRSFVMKFLKLKGFKYLEPKNLTPRSFGIQHTGDSYNGMCVTISAMYLQMRILNVDDKSTKIIDYFHEMSKTKLKNTILKYARYIENTLKKNSKLVNDMNYELYNIIYHELKKK